MNFLKPSIIFSIALFLITNQIKSQDIHDIVLSGDCSLVQETLSEYPLLINKKDQLGRTPLYTAILSRRIDMITLLLENGALVRVGDHNLQSPIHVAGFMNDTAMISLLLEKGAIIDTRAIGGASPLIHSSLMNRFELSKFLIEKGADINIQCNALTVPLYFAALNNNIDYLNFLITLGADLDTQDFLSRTPLSIGVRDGYFEVVNALIEYGADLNYKDSFLDRNLIHLAAIRGHDKIAELLIKKGVNLNEKDKNSHTPLDYANKYGHLSTSELLKKFGALSNVCSKLAVANDCMKGNIHKGEAIVIKLQNGSWGIKTKNHFLVLGYSEIGNSPDAKSIINGYLNRQEIEDITTIFYDLTYHPFAAAFSLQGKTPVYSSFRDKNNCYYVLNDNYKNNYSIIDVQNKIFPLIDEVTAVGSTSVTMVQLYGSNRGYIIDCDGLKILWFSQICDNYISLKRDNSVVNLIKETCSTPDLLFIGTPDGIGPEKGNGIRETFIELMELNPSAVFFLGKEPLERKILYQIKQRNLKTENVFCSENPGDSFFFNMNNVN